MPRIEFQDTRGCPTDLACVDTPALSAMGDILPRSKRRHAAALQVSLRYAYSARWKPLVFRVRAGGEDVVGDGVCLDVVAVEPEGAHLGTGE